MRARCGRMNNLLVLNPRSTARAEVAGEQKNLLKECTQVFKCWVSPDYDPQFFQSFFTFHRKTFSVFHKIPH